MLLEENWRRPEQQTYDDGQAVHFYLGGTGYEGRQENLEKISGYLGVYTFLFTRSTTLPERLEVFIALPAPVGIKNLSLGLVPVGITEQIQKAVEDGRFVKYEIEAIDNSLGKENLLSIKIKCAYDIPKLPLADKVFVFTGRLSLKREEAIEKVEKLGGSISTSFSKKTTHVVLGKNVGGIKTAKLEELKTAGAEIVSLTEDQFLELIGSKPTGTVVPEVLIVPEPVPQAIEWLKPGAALELAL